MSRLFDDPEGRFLVVVNEEGQHSLWPDTTTPPPGWKAVHGPAKRSQCLAFVEEHWTDMRPHGLVARRSSVISLTESGGSPWG
ncbi:MbtH family protein [Nonomuraea sp. NPDC049152]|uniref:MbtH family protein n=1 Tax=Nonomuraea sp. NPDC049152 TaxID=3154350 RepID=UPI0033FC35CD